MIGDVHGCFEELLDVLARLGYACSGGTLTPPPGRQVVFVGDLVDRGPRIAAVVRLVMDAVQRGTALCVRGNHDERLARALQGEAVETSKSLLVSLDQLSAVSEAERDAMRRFLASLPARLELDGGRLLVVHAGELKSDDPDEREQFNVWGRRSGRSRADGADGPVDWVTDYTGPALVVYGHTSVLEPDWRGRTVNLDTGCVFGGTLTAMRYPELTLVSVPARQAYASTAHWRALSARA
ncbi:metallophosphoesterase [Deinococcus sp. KSM4-11]|uniref:metallophosphoesterase n=1 Tax=Deinococcus sp. KSM4-11 TaxID=2568654 RepID=UPI001454E154|nr:metallophosphoesterase [Deinococcus sp. KSM4-11]